MADTVVYAPPLLWGPWTDVARTLGRNVFRISVETTGNVDSIIVGQVSYFTDTAERIEDFQDSVLIENGNSVNPIRVRLKATPTGVQCIVHV